MVSYDFSGEELLEKLGIEGELIDMKFNYDYRKRRPVFMVLKKKPKAI